MTKLYAEISKTESQDDGTVKVWGYASSQAVDSDGEVITADAMKAAIPDYMKFGAVREMHGSNAAGTAIEIAVEDDGRTFFGAHIVDPIAVTKVRAGVYKGFSIGGKVTARDDLNKSVIKGLNLTEISLVDRPANPDATFTCYKADGVKPESDEAKPESDEAGVVAGGSEVEPDGETKPESSKTSGSQFTAAEMAALRDLLKPATTTASEIKVASNNEPIEGGMWQVKSLATVLQETQWFITDCTLDNCNIPQEVVTAAKEAAKSLAGALVVMVQAEADKVAGESGEPKVAFGGQSDDLKKVYAERDALAAELEQLKKQAAPAKGSVNAISKSQDGGGEEDPLNGLTPIVKHDGSLDEVATLIKAAQQGRL